MKLKKKLKFTIIPLLLCFIVLFAASYAWMIMSISPEVTNVDTNVGANGSLEIALLSDKTYVDPLAIRTYVGDSAVAQDTMESNLSWGNVIELADERYGMGKLALHPARLNLIETETGEYALHGSILKVAEFGLDGRIKVLSSDTVSALYEEKDFTYYVDNQRYGIRAIGTISNLTPQQIALAEARTMAQSYTAAAARTVKNAWRDNGPMLMNLLSAHYGDGTDTITLADIATVRTIAVKTQQSLQYVELALRQGIRGFAASQIESESEFKELCEKIDNANVPLSEVVSAAGTVASGDIAAWANQIKKLQADVEKVIDSCSKLSDKNTWAEVEPLLDVLIDADQAYLGETFRLSDKNAFLTKTKDSILTAAPKSGAMAQIAEYAGNYSSFFRWTEIDNVEIRTADPVQTPHLIQLVDQLKNSTKAAAGGWTRANLNDTYGFSMDMAFRCNVESDLLLQTKDSLRVDETVEFPVTQGSGSYMRFTSEDMDTMQLVRLMDTIRIGFLDDKNSLVALAKLNTSNYEEQTEGVYAPLYLYDYHLEEDGILVVGERQEENAAIASLSQNTPTVLSVVVWLDGDHVNNSYVNYLSQRSMSGILNLQFASGADLKPSDVVMKER